MRGGRDDRDCAARGWLPPERVCVDQSCVDQSCVDQSCVDLSCVDRAGAASVEAERSDAHGEAFREDRPSRRLGSNDHGTPGLDDELVDPGRLDDRDRADRLASVR
ncbi:MAG TPA: hypothetical protein VN767_14750 [Streptosporangiaceae bacterium]|nr:hypothetical protein [Streptosporangiaceae bacterium]